MRIQLPVFFRWWHAVLLTMAVSLSLVLVGWFQRASFSSQDVNVTIDGDKQIEAGKEVVLQVGIENNTRVRIQNVQLVVDLPASLVTSDGKRFSVFQWQNIDANSRATKELNVIGQGGEEIEKIRGRAEYSPQGFTGRFVSTVEFSVAPIALRVTSVFDVPANAVSGQEIEGAIHIVPDERISFAPLWVEFVAPENFTLKETNPSLGNNNRWRIEGLEAGKRYTFRFRGIIQGNPQEERTLGIMMGPEKNGQFIALARSETVIRIVAASLLLHQEVSGQSEGSVEPGDALSYVISYENVSDVAIGDVTLDVALEGAAFDFSSLNSPQAMIDKRAHTLTWNKTMIPSFRMLDPGEKGEVRFTVSVLPSIQPQNIKDKNFTISSSARIFSSQRSLALDGAAFEDTDDVTLKVTSALFFDTSVEYQQGGGSLPPRAGEETTYAVTWKANNTTNDVGETRLEAVLPPFVRWNGTASSDASLSYMSETRTVVWELGLITAGTGDILPSRQTSFSVGVTPPQEYRGRTIPILEQILLSGKDTFTGKLLEDIVQSIDSASSAPANSGIVQ